jgi:general secretion pathway protein K
MGAGRGRQHRRARRRQRGIALVAVLWIVVLLSIAAASMLHAGRTDARLARNLAEQAEAAALADAGVNRAILALLDSRPERRWRVDGTPVGMPFAGRMLHVAIQDERGRIDLNTAPDELLAGLLRNVGGLPQDAADALVDRIADWRDPDDLRRLNGAEAADCRQAGLAYGPRNAPFQSVDELLLVLGVTPDLFRRIRPAITVHARTASIDPLVAPRQALAALPGISADRIDTLLRERAGNRAGRGTAGGAGVIGATDAMLAGRAFSITVEAPLPVEGASFRRTAIVRMTGDPRMPYWIHDWRAE